MVGILAPLILMVKLIVRGTASAEERPETRIATRAKHHRLMAVMLMTAVRSRQIDALLATGSDPQLSGATALPQLAPR
jgi:hypothetical protein